MLNPAREATPSGTWKQSRLLERRRYEINHFQ